ncbi:hypothetical protein LCGC14_1651880 [marine sediment metagenome]|uniref:Uncharacterized protein n=1 Tax=marine sediment metagenome TaxID=412755 RepID=A0A0F9IJ28_9ZZZZ
MSRSFFALSLGIGALALATHHAYAQPRAACAPRPVVLDRLTQGFGETRQSIGLAQDNMVVEMFASDQGSWTLTVTRPDGVTCVLAAGTGFETLSEDLPPAGEPA